MAVESCVENFVKFGRPVLEVFERTDRETYKLADRNTSYAHINHFWRLFGVNKIVRHLYCVYVAKTTRSVVWQQVHSVALHNAARNKYVAALGQKINYTINGHLCVLLLLHC